MLQAVNSGQVKNTIHSNRHSNSQRSSRREMCASENTPLAPCTFRFKDIALTSWPHHQNRPRATSGPADPNVANVYTKKGRIKLKNTHTHTGTRSSFIIFWSETWHAAVLAVELIFKSVKNSAQKQQTWSEVWLFMLWKGFKTDNWYTYMEAAVAATVGWISESFCKVFFFNL